MAKKLTRKQKRTKNRAAWRKHRPAKKSRARKSTARKGRKTVRKSYRTTAKRRSTKGRKRDTRTHGARYKFADINKMMGNPRRKSRRNPGAERTLRDGTTVQLVEAGAGHGIVYVHHTDGTMDDHKLPWKKAIAKFKAFKSGKRYSRRASASAYRELAMNNPRRRKSRARRNPSQFPMPFASGF